MEEFALIKSRVNLNRVNLGIALISDLKVCSKYGNKKLILPKCSNFLFTRLYRCC